MSTDASAIHGKPVESLANVTIRFAGDSGDGMQLTGTQFTNASAIFGNDVSTLPDFPAEIRAPAGTLAGVSGFKLQFSSSKDIYTPGDQVDTLVAMNPGGPQHQPERPQARRNLIANEDAFNKLNLKMPATKAIPLADGSLEKYRLHTVPMTTATTKACEEFGVVGKDAQRCKNFFALGLVCWLYSRPLEPIIKYIDEKFSEKANIKAANIKVLKAGYHLGETEELFSSHYTVAKAKLPPGVYREVQGNQAIALGLVAASQLSGKPIFYGSYPITPASDILHELARHKNFGVTTFQAEDEIAAIAAARRAFGGAIRRHRLQRTGHLPQGRGDGPGLHDRIADGDRRRPARRSQHRSAHQDGTVRSLACDVRPQRRQSPAHRRRRHAGRLLRHGLRKPFAWPSSS